MTEAFVVMEYDGSQRESSVLAVFTDQAAAQACCDRISATNPNPSDSYDVECHDLNPDREQAPGCWCATITNDGRDFYSGRHGSYVDGVYFSAHARPTDPATMSERGGLGAPQIRVFCGQGMTPEAARASANVLRLTVPPSPEQP